MNRMRTVLALAGLLALPACGTQVPAGPEGTPAMKSEQGALPAPTPQTVTQRLTADNNGQTIDVAVGGRFAVELVGIPTAGYLWGVARKPSFLSDPDTTGGDTTKAQSQPGFAGGNHWEVFVFTATGPGEGALRLEQRRPWEKDQPPAKTFDVTVRVR